jgi:hypothetical protein
VHFAANAKKEPYCIVLRRRIILGSYSTNSTWTYVNPDVGRSLKLDEVGRSRREGQLQVAEDHVCSFLFEYQRSAIEKHKRRNPSRLTLTRNPPPVRPELDPMPTTVVLTGVNQKCPMAMQLERMHTGFQHRQFRRLGNAIKSDFGTGFSERTSCDDAADLNDLRGRASNSRTKRSKGGHTLSFKSAHPRKCGGKSVKRRGSSPGTSCCTPIQCCIAHQLIDYKIFVKPRSWKFSTALTGRSTLVDCRGAD